MSDDLRFERSTRDWLELGPVEAPASVVQAALLEIDATPQERDVWVPRRFPVPSTPSRAVVAAVVGVILIGGAFLIFPRPSSDKVGGVAPSASPSRTIAPTPSPTPTLPAISGAWRSEPLELPSALLAMAADSCRQGFSPPQTDLAWVIEDVRGAAAWPAGSRHAGTTVGYFGFHQRDGRLQDCFLADLTATSARVALTELWCCFRAARPEPLHLAWATRNAPALVGRVGEGIASVRIELDDGTTAVASIRDDWFAIYLPGFDGQADHGYRAVGLDVEGNVVTTLKATEKAPFQES